jgi:DNA-binding transcriptional ArsR family regulator
MFENSPLVDLVVGRSSVRQRLLALLMDQSCGRLHLRELQRRAGTSPGTASRELARLVAAGLIEREAEGSQVYFRATTTPFATTLRSLLVSMPAPDFKPRPQRLTRLKPAVSATVSTAETTPIEVEPVALEPAQSARLALPVDPEPVEPEPVPLVSFEAKAIETKIIEPVHAESPAIDPPVSIAAAIAQASSIVRAATADPVGMRVARQLAEPLKDMYGKALRGFYLYGARAAGPAPADADVETIIVLERVERYGEELERTSHMYAALSHDFKLVVSRVFVEEQAWDGGPDGILPQVRSVAVTV